MSDRSASRSSVAVATLFALVAALFLPLWGMAIGVVGAAAVGAGTATGWHRVIDGGLAVQLAAVVYTAITTSAVDPLVIGVATLSAVAAWDAGRYGIAVGDQLGAASTLRLEVVHTAWTATLATAGLAVGYGAFLVGDGTGSVVGLWSVTAGVAVLISCFRG